MWGSLIAGGIGALGSIFGGNKKAKGIKKATQAAMGQINAGRDALNASPLNEIASGGADAYQGLLGALGVGGDPTSAGTAFQTFRDSAGYGAALDSGMDAITSNAAARGMLKSGATLKEGMRFGQGLGAQYFNNYIQNLMGASQQGIGAGATVAGLNTQLATAGANAAMGGGTAAANASGNAISDAGGIIAGTISDIWGKG